jgi:hypothetical protein
MLNRTYTARPFRQTALGGIFVICLVLLGGCATERVILLAEEDGGGGVVEISNQAGSAVLSRPMAGAVIGITGGIEVVQTTMEAVSQEFDAALSAMPPPPRRYVLYFLEGTTTLTAASRPVMQSLEADLVADPVSDVDVVGHTDRVGTLQDNDRLASDRAGFVRRMLLEHGGASRVVRAVGRGERELLVPTEDGVREPRNRRVEVTLR